MIDPDPCRIAVAAVLVHERDVAEDTKFHLVDAAVNTRLEVHFYGVLDVVLISGPLLVVVEKHLRELCGELDVVDSRRHSRRHSANQPGDLDDRVYRVSTQVNPSREVVQEERPAVDAELTTRVLLGVVSRAV